MKKFLSFFMFIMFPAKAFANPACAVCTIAIGASLEIARKLGISDNVVGLWGGAFLALLGYWCILWFDKKNWEFAGRNFILMLLSLSMVAFLYFGQLRYSPRVIGFLYIDAFLFSVLLGAFIYIASGKLYAWMKVKNGGHAHFPFEKVVLPVASLLVGSLLMEFYQF